MPNSSTALPRRVARPASAAFSVSDGQGTAPAPIKPRSGSDSGAVRQGWAPRLERAQVPSAVTEFWALTQDVQRFEQAQRALVEASSRAAVAAFDADARASLHRAWAELREACAQGTFLPRARVATIGVSMTCDAAMASLVAWNDTDAARQAFRLTGTVLSQVVRESRRVLVESAGQPPAVSALMMKVAQHVHPLPNERPTARAHTELTSALGELAQVHPSSDSRAAFARCLAGLTA